MFAAALAAAGTARAWLIYTDRDDPSQWVVEIEKPYGDLVKLRNCRNLLARWCRPARACSRSSIAGAITREAEGLAFIVVDSQGHGRVGFEFILREPIEGQRLGAAAVLVDRDGGRCTHSTSSPTRWAGRSGRGAPSAHQPVDRPRAGVVGDVEAIAFFTMRYYPQQKLGDAEVWQAMRRAVSNFYKGQGTEQRG